MSRELDTKSPDREQLFRRTIVCYTADAGQGEIVEHRRGRGRLGVTAVISLGYPVMLSASFFAFRKPCVST